MIGTRQIAVGLIATVLLACAPSAAPAPAATSPPVASPTGATPAPLQVALTGAAEKPSPGDTDGTGTAKVTLNRDRGEVCYEITVSNIMLPATGSHIHSGSADVAGPVVVPFTPPGASGSSNGCATGVDPDLINKIRQDPTNYYVNIHTSDFPGGAVRGQLPR